MEKVFILGGRRGLGAAVAKAWAAAHPDHELVLSSRKEFAAPSFKTLVSDLFSDTDVGRLAEFLKEWKPDRVFCFAGGGPYGSFSDKSWKDHDWALKVSFLSPARLMHEYMQACPTGQWIMTGSAIAEGEPDPNAASYSAAKHALVGLISSIKLESPDRNIRLFSPGFMDTDLLPAHAAPRGEQNRVLAPDQVAADFVKWAGDPQASWHRVCRP